MNKVLAGIPVNNEAAKEGGWSFLLILTEQ